MIYVSKGTQKTSSAIGSKQVTNKPTVQATSPSTPQEQEEPDTGVESYTVW